MRNIHIGFEEEQWDELEESLIPCAQYMIMNAQNRLHFLQEKNEDRDIKINALK